MLHAIDVIIIAVYFLFNLILSLYFSRRAGRNTEEFFLSGRKLPWWIAGTAMVATTFAADTPLAVTELVALKGVAGNWLWWNMVAGGMLTVFFFARLWRRAGIMTDVEFVELRYSGSAAAFLRGFKAVYLGVFMNCIIMGWVNVALADILTVIFGIDELYVVFAVVACMAIVGIYSAISGQWGVAVTDFFQFIIAMGGCIALAVIVMNIPAVGGIDGLKKALPPRMLSFFPYVGGGKEALAAGVLTLSFSAFAAHVLVQWWASWYPGAEPGGGGYIAQKMMSARDERHSMLATLWFTIAHYAVRPWPWILVALATVILYPNLPDDGKKTGYVLAMKEFLPPGMLGIVVAAFLAAYMSTISTHLNWGSSYLVNDLYRRFIRRKEAEDHYVAVSRIVTIVLVVISSSMIMVIRSISGAWAFIIECGAGLGLVLILRWYWWRINAWSEISAMIAPVIGYAVSKYVLHVVFPENLFFIVTVTTLTWLLVTFITKPTDRRTLLNFYGRVRPGGPGWSVVRKDGAFEGGPAPLLPDLVNWILGVIITYMSLFGTGKILFGEHLDGCIMLSIAGCLFAFLGFRLFRNSTEKRNNAGGTGTYGGN